MEPILEVTQQGQRRFVTGEPVAAQPTALARIDPDQVVRQALDQQSSTVQAYLKAVGSAAQRTVDAAPRAPTGYSSEPELRARNTRFYVTIAAYILLAATVAWGIVSLAALADMIEGSWQWPLWLAATGALALYLVKATHSLESERTPEGIELERVRFDGYATERAADGQHAIATAVADAISWRAQSEYADSQARQAATDEAYRRIEATRIEAPAQRQLSDKRRFVVQWQQEDASMVNYATQLPIAAPQAAQTVTRYTVSMVQPDTECLAMMEAVSRIYADCAQRGDNLITSRLPWSQRGDWAAPHKRKAIDVLQRLDPQLFIVGDGGRWRLNSAAWQRDIALSAIKRRWV